MEGFLLTLLGEGAGGPVVPRRATLTLAVGDGRLALPLADAAWQASVRNAWTAALRLTGRRDADALVTVATPGALQGASAGLPLGLLALAALLDAPLPPLRPHFASGGVRDHDGFLTGGAAAARKAATAAQLAPQLGWQGALFIAAPQAEVPPDLGVRALLASDLGTAFAHLAPAAYPRIAAAHRRLRAAGSPATGKRAVVRRHPPPGHILPFKVEDLDVVETVDGAPREGAVVDLIEDGLVLWRVDVPAGVALAPALPRLWALARRGALP